MTAITAAEILDMASGEFVEARLEWTDPERRKQYEDPPTSWTLYNALVCEASFAVDRWRESDIITDETDESMDELVARMADEAMPAVMEVAHAIMAKRIAAELGGKLYRPAQPA